MDVTTSRAGLVSPKMLEHCLERFISAFDMDKTNESFQGGCPHFLIEPQGSRAQNHTTVKIVELEDSGEGTV